MNHVTKKVIAVFVLLTIILNMQSVFAVYEPRLNIDFLRYRQQCIIQRQKHYRKFK